MAEAEEVIPEDEVVYRLIQPFPDWFEPPDRIYSSCFKLRTKKNETGISVFQASLATPDDVRRYRDADVSFPVASAFVREITNAKNGAGEPLNLKVVRVDVDPPLPGHAEIQGKMTGAASRQLAKIFKITDSTL